MSDVANVINLGNDADFDKLAQEEGKSVIVDFWAPWCGPCKMQAPILDELAREVGDSLRVIKVNVDDMPALAQKFSIMSIPTLMIYKGPGDPATLVGVQSKDALKQAIA